MAITKIGTTGILNNLDVPGYLYLSGDNKELRFYNGANYMVLKASGSLSNNYTITLPVDDGTSGQFLKTDGGGVTSWDTVTSSDTTYSTTWVDSSANAILRLTAGGSGSGTDDLTIVAGTNITLTPSGDNLTIDAAAGGIASVVADTTPQLGGNLDMQARLLVGNGGSTGIAISSAGEVTMAAQPAFNTNLGASDINNVTGDGTNYTLLWGTEDFDQNADLSGSTFTAPVAGRYRFSMIVTWQACAAAHESGWLTLVADSVNYHVDFHPYNNRNVAYNVGSKSLSMLVDMAADSTAYVHTTIGGSGDGKVVDLNGGTYAYWSGELVV